MGPSGKVNDITRMPAVHDPLIVSRETLMPCFVLRLQKPRVCLPADSIAFPNRDVFPTGHECFETVLEPCLDAISHGECYLLSCGSLLYLLVKASNCLSVGIRHIPERGQLKDCHPIFACHLLFLFSDMTGDINVRYTYMISLCGDTMLTGESSMLASASCETPPRRRPR